MVLVGCGPSISIHQAVVEENVEIVKQHLAVGTDVNAKDAAGSTPLHYAAEDGHKEIAELLIEKGADVNAKHGLNGSTPLHGAAYDGHKEIVELLIAKGAEVNAKIERGGFKGGTPLDLATHLDNPNASAEIANLLRKHGGKTRKELKAEGK